MKKFLLGSVEKFSLPDLNAFNIDAINDTGAKTSSLHAKDIKIINNKGQLSKYNPKKEQWVKFKTETFDEFGKKKIIKVVTPLKGMLDVKTSDGVTEQRPLIETTLKISDSKEILIGVTLNDRSDLDNKLLIGKTVLGQIALLDADEKYILNKTKHKIPSNKIIGLIENCSIKELGINNIASKIDTGAKYSALHAVNIVYSSGNNGEELVSFDTEHNNKVIRHTYPLVDKASLNTPSNEEAEVRPIINVQLTIGNMTVNTNIALTDRKYRDTPDKTPMKYMFLVGRNTLDDLDLVVDPSKKYLAGAAEIKDLPKIDKNIGRYNPNGVPLEDSEIGNYIKKHKIKTEIRKLQDQEFGINRPKIMLLVDTHRIIADKEIKKLNNGYESLDDAILFSTAAYLLAAERAGFDVEVVCYGKERAKLANNKNDLYFLQADHVKTHSDSGRPVRKISGEATIGRTERLVNLKEYVGVITHIPTSSSDLGISILKQCEKAGLVVMNSSSAILAAKSKVKTFYEFEKNGIDIPKTTILDYETDFSEFEHMFEGGKSIIIKADAGGAGDTVAKIDNIEDLKTTVRRFVDGTPSINISSAEEHSEPPIRIYFDPHQKDKNVQEGLWQKIANINSAFKVYYEGEDRWIKISNKDHIPEVVKRMTAENKIVILENLPDPKVNEKAFSKTIKPEVTNLKKAIKNYDIPMVVSYKKIGSLETIQILANTEEKVVEAIDELRALGRKEKPNVDIIIQELLPSTSPRTYKNLTQSDANNLEFLLQKEANFMPPYYIKSQNGEGLNAKYSKEIIAHDEKSLGITVNRMLDNGAEKIRVFGRNSTEKQKANDRRIIAVRDKNGEYHLLAALDRSAAKEGEIKANISKGGTGIIRPILDLTDAEYNLAIKTAKASGLGITGVDIMSEPPKALEVNDSMAVGRYGFDAHDTIIKMFKKRIAEKFPEVKSFFYGLDAKTELVHKQAINVKPNVGFNIIKH